MSEYQYYEFRAIDRPLTEEQRADVSALSSRAYVTSHVASFVYNYGNFRGDTDLLMTEYFDVMLSMTNWGSRRLIFRIPCPLIDSKEVDLYCISEEIDRRTTRDHKHVLVDFDFHDEELASWTEGEGWLDELVDLRNELLHGDFRVLYLAWLKAAERARDMEDIDDDTREPPVPAGLGSLSPALKTFARFLDIDEDMIAVAAQISEQPAKPEDRERWIDRLPSPEQHDFLVRLSRGERNLSVRFNKRLDELANEAQPQNKRPDTPRRTLSALIESSTLWHQKRLEDERRQAELDRQRELEALAPQKHQVWQEVERLIEEKKAKSYERAVELLKNLHDLAEYQGDLETFRNRLTHIQHVYSNRTALLRRIRESKLMS